MRPICTTLALMFTTALLVSTPDAALAQGLSCYTCTTGSPPEGCTTATGSGREFCIWDGVDCVLDGERCVLDTFTDSLPHSTALLHLGAQFASLRTTPDGRLFLRFSSGRAVPLALRQYGLLVVGTCDGGAMTLSEYLGGLHHSD